MNSKQSVGQLGEDIACEYLRKQGCRIIERNFRKPWGEIDIIVKDKNGVLVFVEVKAIRQSGDQSPDILPEDNLTHSKLKKLQRTASLYVGYNQDVVDDQKGWRIDLVAITLSEKLNATSDKDNLTELIKNCDIKYFENI